MRYQDLDSCMLTTGGLRSYARHKALCVQHGTGGIAPPELAKSNALPVSRLIEADLAEVFEHCRIHVLNGPPPV